MIKQKIILFLLMIQDCLYVHSTNLICILQYIDGELFYLL